MSVIFDKYIIILFLTVVNIRGKKQGSEFIRTHNILLICKDIDNTLIKIS